MLVFSRAPRTASSSGILRLRRAGRHGTENRLRAFEDLADRYHVLAGDAREADPKTRRPIAGGRCSRIVHPRDLANHLKEGVGCELDYQCHQLAHLGRLIGRGEQASRAEVSDAPPFTAGNAVHVLYVVAIDWRLAPAAKPGNKARGLASDARILVPERFDEGGDGGLANAEEGFLGLVGLEEIPLPQGLDERGDGRK